MMTPMFQQTEKASGASSRWRGVSETDSTFLLFLKGLLSLEQTRFELKSKSVSCYRIKEKLVCLSEGQFNARLFYLFSFCSSCFYCCHHQFLPLQIIRTPPVKNVWTHRYIVLLLFPCITKKYITHCF